MRRALLALALTVSTAVPVYAGTVTHARLDLSNATFEVHPDLSYVETEQTDYTLYTERGMRQHERAAVTYYPKSQDLRILEAWVTQPDGTRLDVDANGMFTRPSAAAQGAPGFTGSMTTTVLFPQLKIGSKTHIKWQRVQKTPPLLGFSAWNEADYGDPTTRDVVDITIPAEIPFQWAERGDVVTTDLTTDGVRHIHSEIRDTLGHDAEPNMVSTSDFQPIFAGTTMRDFAEIGTIYNRQAHDKIAVTPEIEALAAKIVGDRTGLDAAHAVYNWVAVNIRYVALFLDMNDGWVPHPAVDVLKNGYGDCKDHVTLMQALLAARGIKSDAALIDWGDRFRDLPVPHPGQFNHVIVYLPDYDVYANPTNPYASFDSFDRGLAGKIVVIASEPGRVAHTPSTKPADNAYSFNDTVQLRRDGTLEGSVVLRSAANAESGMRSAVANATSTHDLADRLLRFTNEGGFGDFQASDPRDLAHPLTATVSWTSPHGVSFQGRFAYMHVPSGPDFRPVSLMRGAFGSLDDRQTPINVGASESTWTTKVSVPSGTLVDIVPTDVDKHNAVGSYEASYTRTETGIAVTRRLTIDHDVYPAADFAALRDLFYTALDDSRAVVVLERDERAAK